MNIVFGILLGLVVLVCIGGFLLLSLSSKSLGQIEQRFRAKQTPNDEQRPTAPPEH